MLIPELALEEHSAHAVKASGFGQGLWLRQVVACMSASIESGYPGRLSRAAIQGGYPGQMRSANMPAQVRHANLRLY